jgi:hypothetical protein
MERARALELAVGARFCCATSSFFFTDTTRTQNKTKMTMKREDGVAALCVACLSLVVVLSKQS